ncbi:hypothetical protein GKZ68_19725 [Hymenobacter sp. BRD128]|uniref:hypothetical protein n=1 Tax=Hymenobacter sp. BRD128 TaxID=2675878 RepID=UPI0015631871|nr:hypothetical protein [Hymenobacter sp. BRD128]QKG58663.1 hypothetical protein GKZ68_19725 [Hymenobacter sp. BRD128]
MQDEAVMVSDFGVALATVDREAALRILLEALPRVELIVPLVVDIMHAAIDSSRIPTIMLAREVLQHYKDESRVRGAIHICVATYLAENDEWHYRRIAELYEVLNYQGELANFLQLCKANANPEIQEIADDAGLEG